ncbi:hypothetical protein RRG08_041452, partial [Elysia crispata]
ETGLKHLLENALGGRRDWTKHLPLKRLWRTRLD